MHIIVENVGLRKTQGTATEREILSGISFAVPSGQILAIIGPSGAGKSSLLRLMNRLDEPSTGDVLLEQVPYRSLPITQLRRQVGMVFQHPALFDGTVADNIAYGLHLQGAPREEQRRRAAECLELVGLEQELLERASGTLSGGQQQRVVLARAIAISPRVLLLDEVTSALDPTSTGHIADLIHQLSRAQGLTILLVTHDLALARRLADRVLVLAGGQVLEEGSADELFTAPQHPETAAFLGGDGHV
jgi:ABC-type methionine transport system ATPase subunit